MSRPGVCGRTLGWTGALTGSNARVTYAGAWQDVLGRPIASANYGTTFLDREEQETVPTASDSVLVSLIAYNRRGEADLTTDPKGMTTTTVLDDAGRTTSVTQSGTDDGGGTTTTVATMTYTPDGGVRTLTATNATTGSQTTTYKYEASRPNNNLDTVARSDLVTSEIYPDWTDGTDRVSYLYNRQGERVKMTDQNGTVHDYTYDVFGRPTADVVSAIPDSAVDGAVRRIDLAYEIRGMVSQVTSRDDTGASSTIVNQVTLAYNEFRQLTSDSQKHSDGGTAIPVAYSYANGSQNTTRRTGITYPTTSRVVTIDYASGVDDALSRVSSLGIQGETGARAAYEYFGLSSLAKVNYPQSGVDVAWTIATSAPAYPGIDGFGRIVDLHWKKPSGSSPDRVRHVYGYDRASNRKYRRDEVARGLSKPFDELYSYDGVHRLKTFGRGTLDSTNTNVSGATQTQSWTLDQTGNWSAFNQLSPVLNQVRAHNLANEIVPNWPAPPSTPTHIDATPAGDRWAGPAHDRNGNMTKMPQPAAPTAGYLATYDAWNRLVKIRTDEATPVTVAEFAYDGLNRRTIKTAGGVARHFYYSDAWQVLEERLDASTTADRVFLWGIRYIDDLVLRDRTTSATLDERQYAIQDANWNVVAILDTSGAVDERFAYEAYGKPIELSSGFVAQADARQWETRFTGQRIDLESALICGGALYYNSTLGRSITRVVFDPSAVSLNAYVWSQDDSKKKRERCDCESVEVLSTGFSEAVALADSKRTGKEYYGGTLLTWTRAIGTGNVRLCKFNRSKKDYTYFTRPETGRKVERDKDDKPQPDKILADPARLPEDKWKKGGFTQKVRGGEWMVGISIEAGRWTVTDFDGVTYTIPSDFLPAGKVTTFRFWVVNSDGTVNPKCDRTWTYELHIDKAGDVKAKPVGSSDKPMVLGDDKKK